MEFVIAFIGILIILAKISGEKSTIKSINRERERSNFEYNLWVQYFKENLGDPETQARLEHYQKNPNNEMEIREITEPIYNMIWENNGGDLYKFYPNYLWSKGDYTGKQTKYNLFSQYNSNTLDILLAKRGYLRTDRYYQEDFSNAWDKDVFLWCISEVKRHGKLVTVEEEKSPYGGFRYRFVCPGELLEGKGSITAAQSLRSK